MPHCQHGVHKVLYRSVLRRIKTFCTEIYAYGFVFFWLVFICICVVLLNNMLNVKYQAFEYLKNEPYNRAAGLKKSYLDFVYCLYCEQWCAK